MHLYLYIRGKFEQVELWKALAQAAFWKLRRINNKTGEEEITLVQGSLRQSILGAFEYVFPKEALPEVCNFFGITGNESYGFGKVGLKARHFAMRRLFGCKKIPDSVFKKASKIAPTFSTEEFERGCSDCVLLGIGRHPIGIKEDEMGEMGGYTYEKL